MSYSDYEQASQKTHIFIIGCKSIGQYGGYETFVHRLISEHEQDLTVQYHVACKANGDGRMDETKLNGVTVTKRSTDGSVEEFQYRNAHVYKIKCPQIGPAVAILYDKESLAYAISYCRENQIQKPVFYILTCRIGPFIKKMTAQIHELGGKYYLNPDGHEWKRRKWSWPVRLYWKWSEKMMVSCADLAICDSENIEVYIREEYHKSQTTYISYGADVEKSPLNDQEPILVEWMKEKGLEKRQYYLIVGRFVPENNYEIMLQEYMKCNSKRSLAIITNVNEKYLNRLKKRIGFEKDPRIKFVGTVYDSDLLKKIRENAYGYLHGHEVGGTNPSLLEALGSTELNLLLDICFNKEVGQDAALYWSKETNSLSTLINAVDQMDEEEYFRYGIAAKERIRNQYSWKMIAEKYREIWKNC